MPQLDHLCICDESIFVEKKTDVEAFLSYESNDSKTDDNVNVELRFKLWRVMLKFVVTLPF